MNKSYSTSSLRTYIKPAIKTRKINTPQLLAGSLQNGDGRAAGAKGGNDDWGIGQDSQYNPSIK